ncbi:MAG: hypothetical protein OQK50_06155 [Deltaproteobacteria bacterium]|jgi:hypothetical protein|nr:hypothetical protein [Deltaproteobacteria bacterium]MCW9049893.1 hypothetical protein [Deltaproteobacteria bacterium]
MYHWYDFVGNVGVLSILLAYFLLQLNKISHSELTFSLMNFFGALLILISLYFEFNLSAFLIEFFWLLISAIGIRKFLANRSTSPLH